MEEFSLEIIKKEADIQKLSSRTKDPILCILSNKLLKRLQINDANDSAKIFSQPQDNLNQYRVLYLLVENEEGRFDPLLPQGNLINFKDKDNYYLSFFKLLKQLFPSQNVENYVHEITSLCEKNSFSFDIQRSLPNSSIKETKHVEHPPLDKLRRSFLNWKSLTIGIVIAIIFSRVSFVFFRGSEHTEKLHLSKNPQDLYIQSDLSVPMESSFLNRSELIAQIDNTFKGNEGIQSTALVGIGGAGKTTLARQYAHQQKANVIWEINAETQENLKASFEDLAQEVSKTEEDQKILRGLLDIKIPEEKEKKILAFVKARLRSARNWFLIFDNVEKFTDIQNYFPQDSSIWGRGKILLTTRDRNIQNNSRVNHVVPIEELTQKQKLNLFTKIMNHGTNRPLINTHHAEAEKFLENLPPFPLDISVAAYYLKSTNISYEDYLENLKNYDSEFSSVQENLLKEAGTYLKTRYGVITLSLEHLIKSHKDFGELLLFISLLDSHDIPRDLLNKYKSKSIVDNFIYHLKKYSLIIIDASGAASGSTFSIHRSTQAIILAYLIKKLKLEKGHELASSISNLLINNAISAIEEEQFPNLVLLRAHFETFLTHKNLLNTETEASLKCMLGCIHSFMSDFIKSKSLIENNLLKLNKNYVVLAPTLICLGIIERDLYNNEKAKDLLEQAFIIYENYLLDHHAGFARVLVHLGDVYSNLEDYEKAKELLERGLTEYKNLSVNHLGMARALTYLGLVYGRLGFYEKSKQLLEQALEVYKREYSNNHIGIAKVLGHIGNAYKKLGDNEKAKNFLEQSLTIFKKLFSENHIGVGCASLHLGTVYGSLGKYEKAKILLEQSLIIYKKYYSENNIWIARVLLHLGNTEKELGNQEKSKSLLESGLKIQKENYSKYDLQNIIYLTQLGDFYSGLGDYREAQLVFVKSLEIYKKKFKDSDPRMISEVLLKLGNVYKTCPWTPTPRNASPGIQNFRFAKSISTSP